MYNRCRNSNWNFIFNSIRYNISNNLFLMIMYSWFNYREISRVIRSRLIKSNFNLFSIYCRLNNILFIISITRYTYILNSISSLINRLSSYRIQIKYIIFFLIPINLYILFLMYRLYISLRYMFISRYNII